MMQIRRDELTKPEVQAILAEHIRDMYATSPPDSVHTLDFEALRQPNIAFWVCWDGVIPAGCIALKEHAHDWGEIKSMRTADAYRGKGVGKLLLQHVIDYAQQQSFRRLCLETSAEPFFMPAREIYRRFGFVERGPFGSYTADPNSVFMEKQLAD